MDSSKQYLLEIVDEQKRTIEKYTNKLRDVVAAHKSLLVEKKALEDTIKILNESKNSEANDDKSTYVSNPESSEIKDEYFGDESSKTELKVKLDSLLTSFSNLVTEKSHMEECFKINQKQLLDDKESAQLKCKELQEQVNVLSKQLKLSENKNQTESGFIKKDSKKSFKDIVKNSKQTDAVQDEKLRESELLKNYEKEIKNLKSELEAKRLIQELSEKKLKESVSEVSKLQEIIRNLQTEHEIAIQSEKEKAKDVKEHEKKLRAVQEERVVSLEIKLAELSETIGSYDRLRLQDQREIQKLKEHIAFVDMGQKGSLTDQQKAEMANSDDYDSVLHKFIEIKRQLQIVAIKNGKEGDFKSLFPESDNSEDVHLEWKEGYQKLRTELDFYKNEVKTLKNQNKSGKEVVGLQDQIKNLQEKVRILSDKNKEMEKEHKLQLDQLKKSIKNDKSRFKEALATSESDYKARVWLLEEQLQKQRERSLALLEEKEQEIHALQSTFQMFLPGYRRKSEEESANESNMLMKNQLVDGPHIVHYANELARRDVEISSLRRSKHEIKTTLRDLQKEVATAMQEHKEERKSLKEEIARLERCHSREGANLEYLKNVVYSFLLSSDPESKRHMCNAIAAVLKFSESELQKVINHRKNSWWSRSNLV